MQSRLHRISEELTYLDTVVTGMNQLQVELEDLSLQVANFDAFHKDVDRVDADLLVSLASNYYLNQSFAWVSEKKNLVDSIPTFFTYLFFNSIINDQF